MRETKFRSRRDCRAGGSCGQDRCEYAPSESLQAKRRRAALTCALKRKVHASQAHRRKPHA
eukprot:6180689-Pleurochrysis_carterae.AAC.3